MNRFEDYEHDEIVYDIEVSMGKWKVAKGSKIIGINGLGPCTAIIVYDPENKKAMVAHLMPLTLELPDMLTYMKKHFPKIENLKIYISGMSPSTSDTKESIQKNKDFVIEKLKNYRFQDSQMQIDWLQFPDQTLGISINCETGEINSYINNMGVK